MKCDRTTLYRSFDKDGVLLYVGISHSAMHRLSQHRAKSIWHKQCVHVELEHFDSRKKASEAEKFAIQRELPMFNIQGKVNKKSNNHNPASYLSAHSVDELIILAEQKCADQKEREEKLELIEDLERKLKQEKWNFLKAESKWLFTHALERGKKDIRCVGNSLVAV
tara:strand:- start:54 stop:551 length:498 start_codon:yes stop_codon:yes gene_type:complete